MTSSVTEESRPPQHFIQIDEDGYFKMETLRVSDVDAGRDWMSKVAMDDRGRALTQINNADVLIEAFDEPYVAVDVTKVTKDLWHITMPYGHSETFPLASLTTDEWDRFHGRTTRGIPFVMSRTAQSRFFNLVDEFEDDAVIVDGERYETKPWLQENPDTRNDAWWTNVYRTEEPRWELNAPSHALAKIVPRLKLQKSRILVPGAGSGNDAAWFAEQGHLVTAVDFSEEAIARAQAKYGHLSNLKFMRADVFNLPPTLRNNFDVVFEHTLYCAITPSRRNDLTKVWRQVLTEQGHLMGVFFTMDKQFGPPYGGSEWEIRSRLQKGFRPLYWTRLRDSMSKRLGHELFIYAQKLPVF